VYATLMRRAARRIGAGLASLGLSSLAAAQLTLSLEPAHPGPGDPIEIVLKGGVPGDYGLVLASLDPGPTVFPFAGELQLGFEALTIYAMGQFPASGQLRHTCGLNCDIGDLDPVYAQAIAVRIQPGSVLVSDKSSQIALVIDEQSIEDCNHNGIDDDCDIEDGTSKDCNKNGIPDECDADCNGNGKPDDCDIASGFSKDCDANGAPDECQPDCDHDGIPDACDVEVASYCARNLSDDGCATVITRVAWIANLSEPNFLLVEGGEFREYSDGTASFHAKVQRKDSATKQFLIDMTFTGRVAPGDPGYPPTGSPKLMNSCTKEIPSWRYYKSFSGTFTGLGAYWGAVYSLSPRGPAFQMGMGANLFNAHFGGASWFHLSRVRSSNGSYLPPDMDGDFNFDLILDCDCDD